MLSSFFKPVPTWSMDRARAYLDRHKPDEYNMVDVRQPEEYAAGHIPGAMSIPLGELPTRLSEIDRGKLTFVYCRSGGRAGNGVALLTRSGFEQAHNIGGLAEWNGLVASGAPEAAMAVFDAAHEPAEYVALAWAMEDSAWRFYAELGEHFSELKQMFETMAVGEEKHRDRLAGLYREISGSSGDLAAKGVEGIMEGGIDREEALAWAKQREAVDVLEFAAAMEANAHDRYILVGRAVGGETERAFIDLAEAEKVHLNQLLEAFTARLR